MRTAQIKGYEDYVVYEDGRIWSNKTNKFLKFNKMQRNYCTVELFNENGSKRLLVHRLVAMAFISNPHNYPQVNHKDENPANNAASNLEWCTAKYNMNYGKGTVERYKKIDYSNPIYKEIAYRNAMKGRKPVYMLDDNGCVIREFASAAEASRITGIYVTNISRAVKKTHLKAGGYLWRYKEERSDDLLAYQS